MLFKKEL